MREKIIVNVASYRRIDSLEKTLESIINQCDEINVILNDFEGGLPPILYNDKVNIFFTDNSLGDAFKFLRLSSSEGFFLTIDDDLIYPPNYVDYLVQRCKDYGNSKVVTLHGRNFSNFPIISYYKSATERYSCLNTVSNDVKVQFGGTGVMCFHSSLMKIPINYFQKPNMADVWVGKYCIENNIDIICLKHDIGYIKYIYQKETIFDNESKNDGEQTKIVNSLFVVNENENKNEEEISKFKVQKTIELRKKEIDYEKINKIFQNSNSKVLKTPEPKKESNLLKLNSNTLRLLSPKGKKRFR